MEKKRFIKNIENFVCGHCGKKVAGSGYTNHCPACLWSRHVDVDPGDRAADCGGLMEPVKIKKEHGEYAILHKCTECGHVKWNKAASEDDFDEIIKLSVN